MTKNNNEASLKILQLHNNYLAINYFVFAGIHEIDTANPVKAKIQEALDILLQCYQARMPFSEILRRLNANGITITADDVIIWGKTFVDIGYIRIENLVNDLGHYRISGNSEYPLSVINTLYDLGKYYPNVDAKISSSQPITQEVTSSYSQTSNDTAYQDTSSSDVSSDVQGDITWDLSGKHDLVFAANCSSPACKGQNCATGTDLNTRAAKPNPCGEPPQYHQQPMAPHPVINYEVAGNLTSKIPHNKNGVVVDSTVQAMVKKSVKSL